MNFPAELKYTKDHEWIRVEGNEAYIGITEFAQRELGDIVYIDITSVGKEVAKDAQVPEPDAMPVMRRIDVIANV